MESETILPCPFCGKRCYVALATDTHWVDCSDRGCGYCAGDAETAAHAIAMHNHVAAAVRDHAAMVAERDALRAQVAQLREPLEILWACMGLTIERFDRHLARQVAATLAATAPGEEATR